MSIDFNGGEEVRTDVKPNKSASIKTCTIVIDSIEDESIRKKIEDHLNNLVGV
jgi:hypothetical protein